MSIAEFMRNGITSGLAIAVTGGLVLVPAVFAEPAVRTVTGAVTPVGRAATKSDTTMNHGNAKGSDTGGSDTIDRGLKGMPASGATTGSSKDNPTTSGATDTSRGGSQNLNQAGSETETSIMPQDGETTKLDTAASEEGDPYGIYNKQQIAVLQQHEAAQHFDASQHYVKVWDTELAELELRAAIMYMPELKIAHRDYCLIALIRGKPLRALAEFMMVVGLATPIPLTEQQQKELRKEASQAHYKRGLDQAVAGKWDEAISELLWSSTYLPADPAIHRSLAFAYASKGDFKMAEQYYQSTFAIDPQDAYARADFAFVLSNSGKPDQALSMMAQAVKLDPDSAALHVDLGWLAESKGDLARAEEEFRAAVRRSPQYSALWMRLGTTLENRGKIEDARQAYQEALKKERSNRDAKAALARLATTPTAPAPSATTTPLDGSSPPSSRAGKTPATAKPAPPATTTPLEGSSPPSSQTGKTPATARPAPFAHTTPIR